MESYGVQMEAGWPVAAVKKEEESYLCGMYRMENKYKPLQDIPVLSIQ